MKALWGLIAMPVLLIPSASFAAPVVDDVGNVTVGVPGAPGHGGSSNQSNVRWGYVNSYEGSCSNEAQSFHIGSGWEWLPSYGTDGDQPLTYHNTVLYGVEGAIGYFEWCGELDLADPYDGQDAIAAAQNSGQVRIEGIVGNPQLQSLTGLETGFDAQVTTPGPITASNSLFSMTATVTPERFSWDLDEGTAEGQHIDYTFVRSGMHHIELAVRWRIDWAVTGLTSYSGTEYMTTTYTKDYPVIQARGVLTN